MSDAGSLACGAEITGTRHWTLDLACACGALVVTADNVTPDLGGHTLSGNPQGVVRRPDAVLRGVRGATVRNGTVEHFDAGVVVEGDPTTWWSA
jgi:hypothetical protein